jgi:hypothetical protein
MTLNLTPADRAAWAVYEAESAAAARAYEQMPISYCHPGNATDCLRCRRPTRRADGVCKVCREEEGC